MLWNRYFIPFFLVLLGVAVFHWIGTIRLYYWTITWYDIPMHFFGGVWVALAALWVPEMPLADRLRKGMFCLFPSTGSILASVIAVGIAWEVYEVVFGIADVRMAGYAFDTALDLVMDTLGGLAVAMIWWRMGKREGLIQSSQ
jgi:hypothetical protein